jgi:hypothetical protein
VSPAKATFVAIELATVVAKLSSLLIAAASSDSVSKTAGDELIKSLTAPVTKLVEAICVVLAPLLAVGLVGVPRKSMSLIIELDLALIKGILFFPLFRLLVKPY